MAPGFRYFVASLSAVFLALGVGIFFGSSTVQPPVVDRLSRRLEELRGQFAAEIEPLRQSNRKYADSLTALSPEILEGELQGVSVALVQTGDFPDALGKLRRALEQAGATVVSTTTFDPEYADKAADAIDEIWPAISGAETTLTKERASVPSLVARILLRDGSEPLRQALESAGIVRFHGEFSLVARHVVVVGGARDAAADRTESLDVPLIRELTELQARVVVAEPAETALRTVPRLLDSQASTVDRADTELGLIAVARALRAPLGHYGVLETARNGPVPMAGSSP
jgi:hypothetical protein